MRKKLFGFLWASLSLHFLFFSIAWGADYPTKPITLVVSATAGGPSDLHARILGDAASRELGVPIVIVNKPGPGGALAASYVKNEKPDGYTFLVTQASTLTSNFVTFPDLSYKKTDFIPVFQSVTVPVNIATRFDFPWKSLRELLDDAKRNPGKLRSGSGATSLTLVWEGLLKREGVDMTIMLYKGAADSLRALLGGHIDCNFDALTPMLPHIEAGKLRLLACVSSKRNKKFPDVPTLKELGYTDFSRDMWNGFYAPAGLPEPVMEKFIQAFRNALSQPDVQAKLEKVGVFANFKEPKEFADVVDDLYTFYMSLAKDRE